MFVNDPTAYSRDGTWFSVVALCTLAQTMQIAEPGIFLPGTAVSAYLPTYTLTGSKPFERYLDRHLSVISTYVHADAQTSTWSICCRHIIQPCLQQIQ